MSQSTVGDLVRGERADGDGEDDGRESAGDGLHGGPPVRGFDEAPILHIRRGRATGSAKDIAREERKIVWRPRHVLLFGQDRRSSIGNQRRVRMPRSKHLSIVVLVLLDPGRDAAYAQTGRALRRAGQGPAWLHHQRPRRRPARGQDVVLRLDGRLFSRGRRPWAILAGSHWDDEKLEGAETVPDREFAEDMLVGGATFALGVGGHAHRPVRAGDGRAEAAVPAGDDVHGTAGEARAGPRSCCASAPAARRAGRSLKTHLLNAGVNAAAGIVTAVAFERSWGRRAHHASPIGEAVSLLNIFTQPMRATRDLKKYESGSVAAGALRRSRPRSGSGPSASGRAASASGCSSSRSGTPIAPAVLTARSGAVISSRDRLP